MSDQESTFEKGFYIRALLLAGGMRLLVLDATGAARETRERHSLNSHAAKLAAEGIVAAGLLSAHIKGEERITLQVQAEKPVFSLIVDVFSDATLRARFTPIRLPSRTERFNGLVMATKHDDERVLYQGVSPVEDQDFESALQGYLVKSQQTVGIVRIGVALEADGRISSAAGLLVEKMPGTEEGLFHEIFGDLGSIPMQRLLADIAEGHLIGLPLEMLDHRPVSFQCTCSRDRAEGLMRSLGVEDLERLLQAENRVEMTCHFCEEVYEFERLEVEAVLADMRASLDLAKASQEGARAG